MRTSYKRSTSVTEDTENVVDENRFSESEEFKSLSREVDRAVKDYTLLKLFEEEDSRVVEDNGFEESRDFLSINREIEEAIKDSFDDTIARHESLVGSEEVEIDTIKEVEEEEEDLFDDILEDDEEEENTEDIREDTKGIEKEKSSVNWKRILIGTGIGVLVISGVFFIANSITGKRIEDINDMEEAISDLYVDSRKDDIKGSVSSKKVEGYLEDLENLKGDENKIKSMESELTTISYYISDNEKLDEYNDNSFDLNYNGLDKNLDKIEESIRGYSVSGLALTASDYLDSISDDLGYFVNLRDELSNIKNYEVVDVDSLQVKVNKVTHKTNKEELQDMLDEISQAKKNAEEIKALKEKATEEALKQAEELQKETENALNNAKEELNTYKEEASNFFADLWNRFFGSKENETSSNNDIEVTVEGQ